MKTRKCTKCKHKYSADGAALLTEDDMTYEVCPSCLNPEYTEK